MRLYEWVNARECGALQRLADATGINYSSIHLYYSERRVPQYANAIRIVEATDRRVTLAELCTPREGPLPPKRLSKRAIERVERAKRVAERAKRSAAKRAKRAAKRVIQRKRRESTSEARV